MCSSPTGTRTRCRCSLTPSSPRPSSAPPSTRRATGRRRWPPARRRCRSTRAACCALRRASAPRGGLRDAPVLRAGATPCSAADRRARAAPPGGVGEKILMDQTIYAATKYAAYPPPSARSRAVAAAAVADDVRTAPSAITTGWRLAAGAPRDLQPGAAAPPPAVGELRRPRTGTSLATAPPATPTTPTRRRRRPSPISAPPPRGRAPRLGASSGPPRDA